MFLTDCASNVFNTVMYADQSLTAGNFTSCGVRPIRVVVSNNTSKSISLSCKSTNMPIIDVEKISTDLRGNPVLETALFGFLAAMYLVPIWIAESIARYQRPINPLNFRSWMRCLISSTVNALTFIGLGYYFYKANMRDNKIEDVCKKLALQDKVIVNPGQTISKLLFINVNFWIPIFDFRIYDENGFKVVSTFKVKLT